MHKQMNNKVVVFDLDGTLLGGNNEIIGGQATLQILHDLKEQGYQLAICTGRLDHDIMYINKKYDLGITERISQNGAVVVKGDTCNALLIDTKEALQVLTLFKNKNIRIELNTISNRYWLEERSPDFPKELYDSHHIVKDFQTILENQPCVLYLVIGEEQELDILQEQIDTQFQNIKAVKTSSTSLEIMNIRASKGKAMISMYPTEEIYAIGDSQNDFDMFPYAYKSYLVGGKHNDDATYHMDTILEALQDIVKRRD
ncbi:MAG: HAD-IIB family hydrolase [Coprobacillaceae bacterium]